MAKGRIAKQDLKDVEIVRHRNGVGGMGFWTVDFTCSARVLGTEGLRRLRAVVFDREREGQRGFVAVMDLTDRDACWRGDNFEDALRAHLPKE